jgi:hypothetical protein
VVLGFNLSIICAQNANRSTVDATLPDPKEKFMPAVADQMVETLAAPGAERICGIVGDSLATVRGPMLRRSCHE